MINPTEIQSMSAAFTFRYCQRDWFIDTVDEYFFCSIRCHLVNAFDVEKCVLLAVSMRVHREFNELGRDSTTKDVCNYEECCS